MAHAVVYLIVLRVGAALSLPVGKHVDAKDKPDHTIEALGRCCCGSGLNARRGF
jgi:hypothetical protein